MSDKIFEIELPQLPKTDYEGLGKAQEQLVMAGLGALARTTWISLASKHFPNSGRKYMTYVNAIQQPEILPGMASISLVGQAAHDIEFGKASYDLRDVFLGKSVPVKTRGQSGKGKYASAKGGFYRFIPFRHTGPESAGALGSPMGSQFARAQGAQAALELGKWIYSQAKQLRATKEGPDRSVKWGERLPAGLAPLLKPHHKSDIFAGTYKVKKQYDGGVGNKYVSFRTISTRVRTGWIMPATPGERIMVDLAVYFKSRAPAFVTQIINAQGGSGSNAPVAPQA